MQTRFDIQNAYTVETSFGGFVQDQQLVNLASFSIEFKMPSLI